MLSPPNIVEQEIEVTLFLFGEWHWMATCYGIGECGFAIESAPDSEFMQVRLNEKRRTCTMNVIQEGRRVERWMGQTWVAAWHCVL